MAYRLIEKFAKQLDGHPVTPIQGPLTPLLIQTNWSDDPELQLSLFIINRGRETVLAVDEHNYHGLSEKMFRAYVERRISLAELIARYREYESRMQTLYAESLRIDLARLTDTELLAFLQKVATEFEQVAPTIYIETLNYDTVLKVVGNANKAMLDAIWQQATQPAFVSFEGRRLADIVRIIKEANDLQVAVAKSRYIYTDYYWTKSDEEILISLTDIANNLAKKEQEVSAIYARAKAQAATYTAWLESLATDQQRLAEYIQMIMEFRDTRKDPIAQIQAVIIQVVTEMLRRVDIDSRYGKTLSVYECLKGLTYLRGCKNELIARANGCISITHPDVSVEVELCDYKVALEEFYAATTISSDADATSVTGQIANKGKVMGTARIILDPHQDNGFEEGDVLVTSMTRPEFVPLMRRAGAVVTNEGGITCHAAIISRELGKPCVIGTKVATRVFKTGDRVEVDADNGIVRRLT